MSDLRVTVADRDLAVIWADDTPATRAALEAALPAAGEATRWGDELYDDLELDAPLENVREAVPEGAIADWPAGGKPCPFWGPMSASEDGEPRAAAPVTVVGRLEDPGSLSDFEGGARVRLEALND
ncbi:hypothetical protein C488_16192 [Natrinema pellirubrum DSM 15624]|uniref:Cyclophilin TM1367-like domain-containing protein n=1 Tax=Natrinema pellirubrum (strain DSM 15624 / CIP 106293 / JCM 10476 / NCIMB 786 / 157) TaxID=797303 RepID=L0JNL1_NATP1|nr:cyclophilin-like family protein [Natrinema pellirubrum]AGB33125.1 hypothetical protein Natpe_3338 [Natrinema pellirubrum DSM 15624]ELY71789.1 hypothetical protein C488_16192 [Natrinema pellirubrum DSM 15624]